MDATAADDVLANLIRQKRLLSTFGNGGLDAKSMPETSQGPALTIAVKHSLDDGSQPTYDFSKNPNDTAPNGDTVVPPSTDKHPYQNAYIKSLEDMPDYEEPSKLRRVLGGLAGGLVGAFQGAKAGSDTAQHVVNAPNENAMKPYTAKTAKYKALADIEASNEKSDLANSKDQSESDLHSAEAEHYRKLSQGLPESFDASTQAKIDEERARLATTEGKNYEAQLKDGSTVTVHEDPNGTMHKVDPTKVGGLGEIVTWDAIKKRSKAGASIAEDAEPKDPFQLWRKQNPDKPVEDWIGEQNKAAKTEFATFAEGYKSKHPNASGDEVATAYSNATYHAPPGPVVFTPGANGTTVPVRANPGVSLPAGTETSGGLNETSATRTMQETAPKVINLVDKVASEVDKQVKSLGPAASRWNEFMAGKVGAPNAEFTKLRTDAMLLQTLLMRMHVGARGGQQLMQHFHDLIDTSKQDPENLKAALGAIKDYAQEVAKGPSGGSSNNNNDQPVEEYKRDPVTHKLVLKTK